MENLQQIVAMDVQANGQAQNSINTKEFGSKYQTKREIYLFFTLNCQAYLPRYENVTIYFLRDLVSGAKR